MSHDAPPVGLSAHLALFIAGLCEVLGIYETRERTAGPWAAQIRQSLHRRLARFLTLFARFQAGTLRPAAPSEGPPSKRAAYERFWDPMPREIGWLHRLVPGMPPCMDLFVAMLEDPQMAAFLAAAPQAGRLLRPLWAMATPQPLPKLLRTPPRQRSASQADPNSAPDAAALRACEQAPWTAPGVDHAPAHAPRSRERARLVRIPG